MELEAQSKDKGEVTKEIHDAENGKGFFFFWQGIVRFFFLIVEDVYQFSQSIARQKNKR